MTTPMMREKGEGAKKNEKKKKDEDDRSGKQETCSAFCACTI